MHMREKGSENMQKTENYGLNKPESTDFYDVEHFNSNFDVIDTKMKELESASGQSQTLEDHLNNKENPHGVTKTQVGLSNVPNVSTNNQTPTYTVPQEASNLESGEKLSVAMGKMARFILDNMSKLAEAVLPAGEIALAFTDESITNNTVVAGIYADKVGVYYRDIQQEGNTITIVFEKQDTDINVKVRFM